MWCAYKGGADVNVITRDGSTLLHLAASKRNVKLSAFLVSIGCNPMLKSYGGYSFEDIVRENWTEADIKMYRYFMANLERPARWIRGPLGDISVPSFVDVELMSIFDLLKISGHAVIADRTTSGR